MKIAKGRDWVGGAAAAADALMARRRQGGRGSGNGDGWRRGRLGALWYGGMERGRGTRGRCGLCGLESGDGWAQGKAGLEQGEAPVRAPIAGAAAVRLHDAAQQVQSSLGAGRPLARRGPLFVGRGSSHVEQRFVAFRVTTRARPPASEGAVWRMVSTAASSARSSRAPSQVPSTAVSGRCSRSGSASSAAGSAAATASTIWRRSTDWRSSGTRPQCTRPRSTRALNVLVSTPTCCSTMPVQRSARGAVSAGRWRRKLARSL